MRGRPSPSSRVAAAFLAATLAVAVALVPAVAAAKPKKPVTQAQLRKALRQARQAQQQAQQALALAQQAVAGQGAPVTTARIADGAVTTPKLADGAVGAGKLGIGAIDAAGLFGPDVIGPSALADNAVTTAALDDFAVNSPEIANGAVGPQQTAVIPAARVTFDATQNTAIPDNDQTETAVTWNQEVFDTDDLHAASSPNLVASVPGIYTVSATVELGNGPNESVDVDTFFDVDLQKNGATAAYTQSFSAATPSAGLFWAPVDLNVSTVVALAPGDTVSVDVSQYSGTGNALALDPGDQASSLAMAWVGPAS